MIIRQEPLTNTVCLDLPASFDYLHILSSCLDGILAQVQNLDEQEIISYNIQLAVQELCTNIVRHAYSEHPENERIYVTIALDGYKRRLNVDLCDKGTFFDESKVEEPNLDEGQVHGYGLYIIKSLMDEVTYSRKNDCNYWHLVKNL